MSSVTRVPETSRMSGAGLTAGDAWRAVRRGRWAIYAEAFARFRYGDGFSHSRALRLQLCLAFIPLVIAVIGLSSTLQTDRMGEVLRFTLLSLTPGASDEMVQATLARPDGGDGPKVALWLGLLFALFTPTTAMGQVERGANGIYGVHRDRPTLSKYGRAPCWRSRRVCRRSGASSCSSPGAPSVTRSSRCTESMTTSSPRWPCHWGWCSCSCRSPRCCATPRDGVSQAGHG